MKLSDIITIEEINRLLKSQLPKSVIDKITVFEIDLMDNWCDNPKHNRIHIKVETNDYHGTWGWTFYSPTRLPAELRACLRYWRKALRTELVKNY